jgi:small subunit ribosomal protein S11
MEEEITKKVENTEETVATEKVAKVSAKKKTTSKKSSTGSGKKSKKKKEEKRVTIGKAYVKATYNNTIVALADLNGNIISWASAGTAGFKGPKKSTPYAAQIITKIAVEKARAMGLSEVSVFVKGVGTGRESAIRALNANGLHINLIKDVTPIPHNGCRAKKPRRV